jgi:hypothetical protein
MIGYCEQGQAWAESAQYSYESPDKYDLIQYADIYTLRT